MAWLDQVQPGHTEGLNIGALTDAGEVGAGPDRPPWVPVYL
ncbi:hypothetical protein KPATCC21470_0835 [Kitasatospora purpeofusca]